MKFTARQEEVKKTPKTTVMEGDYPAVCIGMIVCDIEHTKDGQYNKKGDKTFTFQPIFCAQVVVKNEDGTKETVDRIVNPFPINAKFYNGGTVPGSGFKWVKEFFRITTPQRVQKKINDLTDPTNGEFDYGCFIGETASIVYEENKNGKIFPESFIAEDSDYAPEAFSLPEWLFETKADQFGRKKVNMQAAFLPEWANIPETKALLDNLNASASEAAEAL